MPATTDALIALSNIGMKRGDEVILDRINLTVSRNEIVTLIGPNGAGKSTLIKIALKLIKPDHGSVVTAENLRVGYVPQSVNLDESLPLSVQRFLEISGAKNSIALRDALHHVGAEKLLGKSLRHISGGEMRRVLLARALLNEPDLLILDEPTSGVDISGQAALYALIQWIRDALSCGVLLVSHNLHIVMAATDRVVCLNRHLCCSGTPEDVRQHPEFVSLFGHGDAGELGIYRHRHDHEHDLHGDVREHVHAAEAEPARRRHAAAKARDHG
ncbi:zinc ABC transporter ATP-binding protein ZnuC [Candidatus Spongiihabitans sp.]|uniref:zinc ABC transporter ATP-binding protein ZnuC n=1 Tax=Candidatus Spongiihabitans sp. TaxID=3101308 RepID=UPI003C7D558D